MAKSRFETRILVVDDEKFIRLTFSAKLKKAGYVPFAVATVEEAVTALKAAPASFSAIITDIMMGDLDGFVFRDIVRGIAPNIPIFFLTALDPEEGGGFLKRIMEDAISYYLPKAVSTETLLNRVRQVIASYRVKMFIQNKIDEDRKSLELAAHIQRSLLPVRSVVTPRGFYATYWRAVDVVSGDLFEAVQFGTGCYLYVLGDIQGHGTSAALAMTAVQSFLKNFVRQDGNASMGPEDVANMLQKFFRANLTDVTYMTALICVHKPLLGSVRWISCGAPDLIVMDGRETLKINPEKRGGIPIGLFADTIYSARDVVETSLTRSAVCLAYTDGVMDISRDAAGEDVVPPGLLRDLRIDLVESARRDGTMAVAPAKFIKAVKEIGYGKVHDDITLLAFGARYDLPGIYEAAVRLSPDEVDVASQRVAGWCREQGWPEDGIARVQLVFEEKLMNIYDHGLDERNKLHEVVSVHLRKVRGDAVLTVWDRGTEEPSIAVAAGDAETAFAQANQNMAGRGRGRLIVRQLCDGIERNRYPPLNETVYHIPLSGKGSPAGAGEN